MMDTSATPQHDNSSISVILLVLAWASHSLSQLSMGDVFDTILKALSIISITLLIAINWRKGVEEIIKIVRGK